MEEARIHQLSIINVIFITKSRVQSVEIGKKWSNNVWSKTTTIILATNGHWPYVFDIISS